MKRMISSIGPYALDSDIAGHHGLAELSRAEYLVLPKDFPDERIYKVPDYELLGFRWNHLLIGVINSRIYKISPQIITEDLGEAERAFTATFAYLFSLMGEPSGKMGSGVIWRVPEGNVILEQDRHGDVHCVQFFLTSGLPFVGQSIVQNSLTSLRLQFSAFFARLGRILLWSPLGHTDQENLNWCMARAVEWDDWPMWISLPIAPILFTFVSWLPVTVAVLVCNVLWWPIKHRWINLRLAELVGLLCRLLK
jgi:hypothetical protein